MELACFRILLQSSFKFWNTKWDIRSVSWVPDCCVLTKLMVSKQQYSFSPLLPCYLDCHMVPHGAGWHSTCDCLQLGAQVRLQPPRWFHQAWGAWPAQTGGSSAGETLWHGGSWWERSRKHRASSTTFCCQSKSQGHSRFRGENKTHVLVEKSRMCNTAKEAADGPICRLSIKTNVNPMNYVYVNHTLDNFKMLPAVFFFFFLHLGDSEDK